MSTNTHTTAASRIPIRRAHEHLHAHTEYHEHDPPHEHQPRTHTSREIRPLIPMRTNSSLSVILGIIRSSGLAGPVKEHASRAFYLLGEAEAAILIAIPVEQVAPLTKWARWRHHRGHCVCGGGRGSRWTAGFLGR